MLRYHYDRLSSGYIEALREAIGARRDRRARSRGHRVGADGARRADRHALDPLGRRRACPEHVEQELARIIRCVLEADDEAGRARRDRFVPAGALDDRCRGRGARQRHPGGGDRREVRPARQAHRRRGRARERPLGARGGAAPRGDRRSTRLEIDVVMYYGSMWKDYAVWQAAPQIAHRIGATNAFAVEYDNVSHGTPIALRIARDMLRAEDELRTMLVVAACRESYLLDYANERSRFMFNFGDGAVAGLLVERRRRGTSCSAAHGDHRRLVLAAGARFRRAAASSPNGGYRYLDVADPRRDEGRPRHGQPRRTSSRPRAARVERSGAGARRTSATSAAST